MADELTVRSGSYVSLLKPAEEADGEGDEDSSVRALTFCLVCR